MQASADAARGSVRLWSCASCDLASFRHALSRAECARPKAIVSSPRAEAVRGGGKKNGTSKNSPLPPGGMFSGRVRLLRRGRPSFRRRQQFELSRAQATGRTDPLGGKTHGESRLHARCAVHKRHCFRSTNNNILPLTT